MSRHKDKGRIEGPFVPMLIPTINSPAWRAMSPYARLVYMALKSRYGPNIKNNGRIYLSTRDGAEETGFNDKTVARCLRELEHYGFIVMTEPGCLGVNGKGKAPHWRLTELGYMNDPPTRDFLKWNGEPFHEQKSPEYYKRQERRLAKLRAGQKQNPAPAHGADCTTPRCIPLHQGTEQLPGKVHQPLVHIDEPPCTSPRCISRVNHSVVLKLSAILMDPWTDYSAGIYRHNIMGDEIASVGASVATLGTFDAGLTVTNPGVAASTPPRPSGDGTVLRRDPIPARRGRESKVTSESK